MESDSDFSFPSDEIPTPDFFYEESPPNSPKNELSFCSQVYPLSFFYGYDELKLARDAEGDYVIDADFSDPEQHTRKRFLFWGENPETSELLRKIYNNQYDELPEKIQKQLQVFQFHLRNHSQL